MIINPQQQPSVNVVLNQQLLKETTDYKYLGLHLNNRMSCDNHWVILSRKLCSNLFLFKQMKRLGFNVEQIVNSYKSLSLSLIDYVAPLLTSAKGHIISNLSRYHKRFLRIINCSIDAAVEKYNLLPPAEHIDKRCESILARILKDKSHPITVKHSKDLIIHTRSTFNFEAPIPKTNRYYKSFVPKTLRALREDFKKNTPKLPTIAELTIPIESEKVLCTYCGNYYKKRGLKLHQRSCLKKIGQKINNSTPDTLI